jgi:hypothetical protein
MSAVVKGLIPERNPMATPPKAAWDIPEPRNDTLRRTMKVDMTPAKRAIAIPAMNALCIKP